MTEKLTTTTWEETLVEIGGRLWERGDKRRIYFNDLASLYGLEVDFYNTGNVSSAKLDGETISNSAARKILGALGETKIWWDLVEDKWCYKAVGVPKGPTGHEVAKIVIDNIKKLAEAAVKQEDQRQVEDEDVAQNGIVLHWQQGSPLSGWTAFGGSRRALEAAGIGRDVEGWGWHVTTQQAAELGAAPGQEQHIVSAQVVADLVADEQQAQADAVVDDAISEDEKRVQAVLTEQPVLLSVTTAECDDPGEECNMDRVERWAMPDGGEETTRQHTW